MRWTVSVEPSVYVIFTSGEKLPAAGETNVGVVAREFHEFIRAGVPKPDVACATVLRHPRSEK